MKVLIVEDDQYFQSILIDFLVREKYSYDAVMTYSDASEKIALYDYDCILLDISLPDGTRFTRLDELNEVNKSEGIIIISARNSIDDKIKGLNLGADDYLTKPFHVSELNARIQAVIRRKKFDTSRKITFANIELDLQQVFGTCRQRSAQSDQTCIYILFAKKNHFGTLLGRMIRGIY